MTAPIVVIGATGVVGQGVCEAVIAAGRPVIAVGRSRRVLAALRERYGRVLTPLEANLANDTDGRSLRKRLGELTERPVGAIAAICGSSQPTSLLDDRVDCLRRRFDKDVLPHLVAARHVLPQLQTHGVYIVLSGPGTESPWAGFGQQSVASASLRMLARVLHKEARTRDRLVQLLAIDTPVEVRYCERRAWCWPTPFEVGATTLSLIESTNPNTRPVVHYSLVHRPCASAKSNARSVPAVHGDDDPVALT